MPLSATEVRNKINDTIDKLNTEYKLELPDLRPKDLRRIAAPDEGRSKRCIELLNYLCAREGYKLNGIIKRYDLECRQIWSAWRCKHPSDSVMCARLMNWRQTNLVRPLALFLVFQ